jgi:hypothetical protein
MTGKVPRIGPWRHSLPVSRPSPLQNRCAPDGCLHAVPARGTLTGNRGGRIHGADQRLGRSRWKSRAWIACLTEYRGWLRPVMGDGYTEIFFLDEATALAAGHRPCFLCRRAEARAFAVGWAAAHGLAAPPRVREMDRTLHAERTGPPERTAFAALPPGSIFAADGAFFLRTEDGALRWSFEGYAPAGRRFAHDETVAAVTPRSARAVLAGGYAPRLHPSAVRG